MISYSEIIEAQAKCDVKAATAQEGKRGAKRKSSGPVKAPIKRTRKNEVEVAKDEIKAMGLEEYYSVLKF